MIEDPTKALCGPSFFARSTGVSPVVRVLTHVGGTPSTRQSPWRLSRWRRGLSFVADAIAVSTFGRRAWVHAPRALAAVLRRACLEGAVHRHSWRDPSTAHAYVLRSG